MSSSSSNGNGNEEFDQGQFLKEQEERIVNRDLKEDIESLLDQIVKTFEGVVSEKYLDLQFLKHLISRIEVMLSAAKKVKLYADTNCDKEEEA
uniref:Uncharacterized protein n=1 Tax=Meloidogyne hapla TaxID=6305 RepID=A0A1I8BIP5_MELHA